MDNKNVFASNLNRYMEQNGKSRKEVCEAIGVSYFTFSDWCTGKKFPRISRIEQLAEYFGIKKSDLIEEKPPPEMQEKNDADSGIVMRLGSDAEFCELVKLMYKLDEKQIRSVRDMLSSFIQ